jgi:cell division protein FtsB
VAPSAKLAFTTIALALLVLIGFLQWRFWTGPWSLPEVRHLESRVKAQRAENETLRQRNARSAADVQDLKTGKEAVEERARTELGMTRPGEVFYQVVEPPANAKPPADAAAPKK